MSQSNRNNPRGNVIGVRGRSPMPKKTAKGDGNQLRTQAAGSNNKARKKVPRKSPSPGPVSRSLRSPTTNSKTKVKNQFQRQVQNPSVDVTHTRSRVPRTGSLLNTASQSRFSRRSDLNLVSSRRSVTLSESRLSEGRNAAAAAAAATRPEITPIQVYDEDGNDVTPKPLFTLDPSVQRSQLFNSDNQSTAGTPTDVASFTSLYQTGTQSIFAQPFSRSIYGSASNRSLKSRKSSIESSEEITESGPEITTGLEDVMTVRKEEVEELTEEDLNKVVNIILEETDTLWLFDQIGTAVSEEADDAKIIEQKNQTYDELCKTKEGNDRFSERGMQTFNFARKNKEIQAEKVGLADAGINVTTWDMYDTYASITAPPPDDGPDERSGSLSSRPVSVIESSVQRKSKQASEEESEGASRITESRASMLTTSALGEAEPDQIMTAIDQTAATEGSETDVNPQWETICNGDSIKQHLVVLERVVTENIYQPKQAAYRGLSVLMDPDKEKVETESATETTSPDIMTSMGPTLDRLWSYGCSLTKGRNVADMAWNKKNCDILAVAYGQFGFTEQSKSKGGLACCWNIKNPEYPERVYHCKSSVTAVNFSTSNPNLLAVGLYDGTVCIYNVRSNSETPVADSFDCPGKHSSPVWQLCWIEREKGVGDDRGEILVSICADGRIVQWSIRKGFECVDLMKLKRTGSKNPQKKKEKSEAFISRQAPGMCFDFHQKDTNMYLAGTEEGLIHKCSCSYNEQFLDTFTGHTGPMYKVKWSPFSSDVFLSCSADWSIRLWTQSELKPVLSFFSTTKAVHDICWSPYSPTVFCAVNEGAVEIWDLCHSTLDPLIITLASPGIKLSTTIFSKNSNSILVGDSDGLVSVYQLRNMQEATVMKKIDSLTDLVETTLSGNTDNKNGEDKRRSD